MFGPMFLTLLAVCSAGAQSPDRPDWSVMVNESTLVVVGVPEAVSQVVRPDKMRATSARLPSGKIQVTLPSPNQYGVGRIVRMRINEVLKTDGKVKMRATIAIFLPNLISGEGEAVLSEGKTYIVFLHTMVTTGDAFAGSRIYEPTAHPSKYLRFNPTSSLKVVRGSNGVVLLTGVNSKVISEIKASMHPR